MGRYEIRTMQEDIEELKKKLRVPGSERVEPLSSKGGPPEKLPVAPAPVLAKPPEPLKKPEKRKKKRKILIPVILVFIGLLIAVGIYYWWNFLRTPSFLAGADEFEIIEPLEINIPADVSKALEEKYTFFIYLQKEGSRAGLVVKIVDQQALKTGLRNWEQTMKEDLMPIFLGQELGQPATEEFQDNVYKDIAIRYLNFSDPLLTIDYAIVGDYLIVTTSKESMYRVIDLILEEPVEEPEKTGE